jgi:hypothetical protein
VLREINFFNSNGHDALELLKLRLAICVHDKHGFYNDATLPPESYAKWKELEKGDVQKLVENLLINRKTYSKKLQNMKVSGSHVLDAWCETESLGLQSAATCAALSVRCCKLVCFSPHADTERGYAS